MLKPIAFYLPQFHPIPENDAWWGPGFTEWRNVARGRPSFEGHYQPHLPGELGFYDLRLPEVQHRQAALAREHGVHAFCYYVYWFAGRRVLERPLEQHRAQADLDFPYCLCWANENWTRTWDGAEKDVLLAQQHGPEDDVAFLEAMRPHLTDARYLKVGGKPLLAVYRVDLFPDARATAERWQALARSWGLPGLHLCAVQFYGIEDPAPFGFDASIEFPPHQLFGQKEALSPLPRLTNPSFRGTLVDYGKVVDAALARPAVNYRRYRGVMVGWDNTARRQDSPHIFVGNTPQEYQSWLTTVGRQTRAELPEDEQLVFINAWNEWAEGAHLEPDVKYGRAWLEATRAAVDAVAGTGALLERLKAGEARAAAEVLRMLAVRDRSIEALRADLRRKNRELSELEQRLAALRQQPGTWLKEALREQVVKRPGLEASLRSALHQLRRLSGTDD